MADIFISHVEEDSGLAVEIASAIQKAKFSTWYYERDNVPGPTYLEQITRAIDDCTIMLVVVSKRSIVSHQVSREIEYAHNKGKMFLPVLVDLLQKDLERERSDWLLIFGASVTIQIGTRLLDGDARKIVAGLQTLRDKAVQTPRERKPASAFPQPSWKKYHTAAVFKLKDWRVLGLMVDNRGKYVLTNELRGEDEHQVRLWSVETGAEALALGCFWGALSPDGDVIAAVGKGASGLQFWSTASRKLLHTFEPGGSHPAFSSDGRWIVIAGPEDGSFTVLEAATEKVVASSHIAGSFFQPVGFSFDSKHILTTELTAEYDEVVRVWEAATGQCLAVLPDTGWMTHATFSPDGTRVLVTTYGSPVPGARDKAPVVWDWAAGKRTKVMAAKFRNKAVYAAGGKLVLVYSGLDFDPVIAIHDAESGTEIGQFKAHKEHTDSVTGAQVAPNGNQLVTIFKSRIVCIWNIETRRELAKLRGHSRAVTSVAYCQDCCRIVTASDDGTVRVWATESDAPAVRAGGMFTRLFGSRSASKDLRFG